MERDPRQFVEQELGKGKRRIFLLIYPNESEIWIDLKGLPQTAVLCAMCDGIPLLEAEVGGKKKVTRTFVSIDWAIDKWGGDQVLVDAIKKRRTMILDRIEEMRAMIAMPEPTTPKPHTQTQS